MDSNAACIFIFHALCNKHMPMWCLERALQGKWSRCILFLSSSWWIKSIGSKTSGETSRSTACGRFVRQYGTLPLFWQNFPYHWYVVQFWFYFSVHLKLLFNVKWLYSALIPLCLHLFVYGPSFFMGVMLESTFEWHDGDAKCIHHHHDYYYYYYYYYYLFLFWHYSPWWTLASSKIVLHCPQSCDLHLQFLTPIFFRFWLLIWLALWRLVVWRCTHRSTSHHLFYFICWSSSLHIAKGPCECSVSSVFSHEKYWNEFCRGTQHAHIHSQNCDTIFCW